MTQKVRYLDRLVDELARSRKMKKIILLGLIFLSVNLINAQINALTESGDEVILYEDGSWKYVREAPSQVSEIEVNDQEFKKNSKSTFLVKSKKLNIGIWINPEKWSFEKGDDGGAAEYKFEKKGSDIYAMLIAEKIEIPIKNLRAIAIDNAKVVAPDIKVIQEDYRTVNGIKLLMMQMAGTLQGIKFTYFGYYYSNGNGSIQLLTYTGTSIFDKHKKEMELMLNGLVEL